MSKRQLLFLLLIVGVFLTASGVPTNSLNSGQASNSDFSLIAGRNVNMVSGTKWPGGDPWLQRQNEPSIAVSTRNPLHLLAGANDYRSINMNFEDVLPGFEKKSAARDAWLGVFKSYDGGQSWTSTLLPGYIHADTTPPGAPPSPLLGYEAAADPVVRAGTNGLFYYSGITFNRGQRGLGKVFVARFIDNNNKETGAIEYLDTQVIDIGNPGHFIDKPWIAVDIPRLGSPTTILPNGQIVPCGNVYIVYTSFMGNLEEGAHSKIMFSMSTDCGATWTKPTQITDAGQPYQAAALAINPVDGRPYVAYRRFAKDMTDAIMLCWAERKGKETVEGYWHGNIKFSKPIVLAEIAPFDQPTSEITFRTNDYPTMTIDKNGVIYVAWSQRGLGPSGEGKIMMKTSADGGLTWQGPALVDGSNESGYEFMPSLTSGAGKVMMLWYDQQYDLCGHFADEYIQEIYPIRHTIDVRAAEVHPIPNPYFSYETIQVSRFPWYFTFDDEDNPIAIQLQHNMPNLRIFGGGKVPFLGDYIDISPSPMFVPNGNGWAYNTDPASKPVYHAVWTDNRDVRPPGPEGGPEGDWTDYVAPGEGCTQLDINKTGIRNQNIYTSLITEGIIAGSPGNTKPLNIDRAFVVFVKNTTGAERTLQLKIVETPGVTAYFMKAGENKGSELEVTVPPYSSVSATVMVEKSSNQYATVRINVMENSTLLTYIVLNPDSTNPFIEDPEGWDPSSPHVGSDGEIHTPHVGSEDVINWDYSVDSPHVGSGEDTSPHVGSNDDWVTPHVGSGDEIISGSTIHVGSNNHVILSNIVNPHVGSDDFPSSIPENSSMTDIIWIVENLGNTTSTFSLSTFPFYDYNPDKIAVQLIVYKVYTTPTALGCELKEQEHHEIIINQTSPHVGSDEGTTSASFPSHSVPWYFSDVTFSIPPKGTGEGEVQYKVILRYMDKDTTDNIKLNSEDQGIFVESEAPDIIGGEELPRASALVIKTRNIDLDNGTVDTTYDETLEVEGGYGNYEWTLGGEAANWLSIGEKSNGFCEIYGTAPTEAGTYTLTVTIESTDSDYGRPTLTATKTLSIRIADPLEITTDSLPDAVFGVPYYAKLEATGGFTPYTWSLKLAPPYNLPPGLSLNSSTGEITGTPTAAAPYPLNFNVTDSSNPIQSTTKRLSIQVVNPLFITKTILYDAFRGGAYVDTLLAVGGTYPYIWSIIAGSLPDGLALTPGTNIIEGTVSPNAVTSAFTVQVTDYGNPTLTDVKQITIHVYDPPQITTSPPLPDGNEGISYSVTLSGDGGNPPYTWSVFSGALPPGLSLNSVTGEISGIPTSAGSYQFQIHMTDSSNPNQTAGANFSINIETRGGLIAYYPFNGNADDASGNGNHGTIHGGATFTEDRFGNPNGAINFDGSDDYVELPNESNFDLTELTIYAIVKVPDHNRRNYVISKGSNFGNYTIMIHSQTDGNPAQASYAHQTLGGNWSAGVTNNPVPLDEFFHIAVTLTSTTFKSYLNGNPQDTAIPSPPLLNNQNVIIGALRHADIPDEFFIGVIDDIRIYNRALSASEIQALYAASGEGYKFVSTWGSKGTGDSQFNYPWGIAVDSSGNVYVAEPNNHRIQKFSSSGDFITKWGTEGSGNGQFRAPYHIAVDSSGNVYVADSNNNRIQKFNSNGTFVAKWGTYGTGDGQFYFPTGIAVDSSGNFYVADTLNYRIQKFNSSGVFITKWASQGSGDGQFNLHYGIAVDSYGHVYVADANNHRIQKFTSSGIFLGWWGLDDLGYTGWHDPGSGRIGRYGSGNGQLCTPEGIAVDSSGYIYVADTVNHRIQKFSSSGDFITKWGSDGSGNGQFHVPAGIAVDSSGYVYVADSDNNRVQKFKKR